MYGQVEEAEGFTLLFRLLQSVSLDCLLDYFQKAIIRNQGFQAITDRRFSFFFFSFFFGLKAFLLEF